MLLNILLTISRLTDQKGLDLINAVMDGLVDEFTQLVVIGTYMLPDVEA